ncbi:MAG TPA: lysylphosphatidylglycerol synthase transmembrane domain-containing protein [Planctomycetota bacterium]|nr:lysylphosphatidylglycerol synthase transmembrane domain-containing protein [Planctomycetota bacterium]
MALPKKFSRRLFGGVLLGVVIYLGIVLWADAGKVAHALRSLPLWVLPAACGLSLCNYVIRFWKWQRYLDLLGIQIERRASWLVYFSGFALSVTPGKLGEVFKSWLLKRLAGTSISTSAPIVIAERFTDLLAYLILIAFGGIASYPEFQWVFWLTLALSGVGLALAGSRAFARLTARLLKRTPYLWRISEKVEVSFESTRILLAPREIVLPTLISVVGWGMECTGFWLIANALGGEASITFSTAVFAYALGAVAGAVVLIAPGGLGLTEFSIGTILRRKYEESAPGAVLLDVVQAKATTVVLLTRLCTLWFAVVLGLIATSIFTKVYGEVSEQEN